MMKCANLPQEVVEGSVKSHLDRRKSTPFFDMDKVLMKINQDRIRIGVDLHTLEGLHQGSRTHCIELFSRTSRLMPEDSFFFFADFTKCDPFAKQRLEGPNVNLVQMPHRNSFRRLGLQLPFLAAKYRLDVLHTQYIAPLWLTCPSAVTVHDILFEEFPQFFTRFFRLRSRILVRHSAKRARLIYSVSEFSKNQIKMRYAIHEDRITTLYNAADSSRFKPGREGEEEVRALGLEPGNYLLTVGRLEPRKNHKRLLEAFARLSSSRPKLVIVGQKDFGFEDIELLAKELGIMAEVLFLDAISDSMLPSLYRHARLFIYPSIAEGFGMPIIEAMASGTPVITSRTSALSEIAAEAAVLIDPYDPVGLADAINDLLEDKERAARLRTLGSDRARDFNWDVEANKLVLSYRQQLSRKA
jgi:glycosyltransferase involved in cell wall biosynthesis